MVSPVITQALAGEEIKPSPHKIKGIGTDFVPKNLDLSMVDRVELATDEESKAMARRLMQEDGILCGISCGAAMAVAFLGGGRCGWLRCRRRCGGHLGWRWRPGDVALLDDRQATDGIVFHVDIDDAVLGLAKLFGQAEQVGGVKGR